MYAFHLIPAARTAAYSAQRDLIEAELLEQRLFDDFMRDQKPNRWTASSRTIQSCPSCSIGAPSGFRAHSTRQPCSKSFSSATAGAIPGGMAFTITPITTPGSQPLHHQDRASPSQQEQALGGLLRLGMAARARNQTTRQVEVGGVRHRGPFSSARAVRFGAGPQDK